MKDKTLKQLVESIKASGQPKTSAYDTSATVTRVENGVAWVHIPGGVTETPVKLTINAKAGDNVQVRVSGGRAFMVGNASAPPTDDHTAKQALAETRTVSKVVKAVQTVAEKAAKIAASAQQIADEGKAIAEATNQYFWHDDEGAHVTTTPQETDPTGTTGLNSIWNSLGLLLRNGANILTQLGQSAVAFYDGLGNNVENIIASFGSNGSWIGRIGSGRLELNDVGLVGMDGNNDEAFRLQFANASGTAEITEIGKTKTNINTDTSTFQSFAVHTEHDPVANSAMYHVVRALVEYRGQQVVCTFKTVPRPYIPDSTHSRSSHSYRIPVQYGNLITYLTLTERYWDKYTTTDFTDISMLSGNSILWMQVNTVLTVDASTTPSYTFGARTEAKTEYGAYSFASGETNSAKGSSAQAHGLGLIASSDAQMAVGKYNVEDANDDYAFIVGNGTDDSNRSNAFTVGWDGNLEASGAVKANAVQSYTPTYNESAVTANCSCTVSAGMCSFIYRGANVAHSTSTVLCTLPDGARPTKDLHIGFVKNSGVAVGTVTIGTNGEVTVATISSSTATGRIYFNCTYPVV